MDMTYFVHIVSTAFHNIPQSYPDVAEKLFFSFSSETQVKILVYSDGQCPFGPWNSRFCPMIPATKKRLFWQKQGMLWVLEEIVRRYESILGKTPIAGARGWNKSPLTLVAYISIKEQFGPKNSCVWKNGIWSKRLYHMDCFGKFELNHCELAQKTHQLRRLRWILACFPYKHKRTIWLE